MTRPITYYANLGLLLAALHLTAPASGELIVPMLGPGSAAPEATVAPRTVPSPDPRPQPSLDPRVAAKPVAEPHPVPVAEPVRRIEAAFNPALVYGDRVLSEDTAWRGEVLVEGVLTVGPQATLSVEPGTVVRFRKKGAQAPLLVVQGRIVAAGTKEVPVLFSSSFTVPAAGDWQGILLLGSEKKNLLENCRIEGAETGLEVLYSNVTLKGVRAEHVRTGMRFQDALVVMDGGGVADSDTALRFSETEATLRSLSLTGNRQGVSALHSSIYLLDGTLTGNQAGAFSGDSSRVKIQGGALTGNGSGLTLLGCEGSVTGVRLAKNREFGLSLAASRVKVSGNVISGNGNNGVIVTDGAAVAWDNAIFENAGYDLYHAGVEEFRAPANWWGGSQPKIYDNNGRGRVLYAPVLGAKPQERR
jgi:hypothetical protein